MTPRRLEVATKICTMGNYGVKSFWDNVPTASIIRWLWASQDVHEKLKCEVVINLVIRQRRKMIDTPYQKVSGQEVVLHYRYFVVRRPAGGEQLSKDINNVDSSELGKPNKLQSYCFGHLTARKGEGLVGKKCEKKQKPLCNVRDTSGLSWQDVTERKPELLNYNNRIRKNAHFSLVITKVTISERSKSNKWSREY